MELFLEIIEQEVINVSSEKIDDKYKSFKFNSIDELEALLEKQNISSSLEVVEKINELTDSTENNESLNTFNIKHWVSNRSFGELIDMFEHEEIIKPDMQREFVWDSLKCSRLIESIILGLPIPPLFLLEIDNNKYELIDGLQRLTTLYNFVKGNPWQGVSKTRKNITSKLSTKVFQEIQGKTFIQLDPEYQRSLKRSTIPLIEFRQLEPNNLNSKYLIFERINTGSEKLNPMQIRKSLAHGIFIKSIYKYANGLSGFTKLFSTYNLKKDVHVEAFLRICLMHDYITEKYTIKKDGMCNILNDYCETNRYESLELDFTNKFEKALLLSYDILGNSDEIFRRVDKNSHSELVFSGNLNISIMEAFIAVLISKNSFENINADNVRQSYKAIMFSTLQKALQKEEANPFTTSTGSIAAIDKRLKICNQILEI